MFAQTEAGTPVWEVKIGWARPRSRANTRWITMLVAAPTTQHAVEEARAHFAADVRTLASSLEIRSIVATGRLELPRRFNHV